MRYLHISSMAKAVTIRNVPDEVTDGLAAQAALRGQSLQEYLVTQLTELAGRPSVETWVAKLQARKRSTKSRLSAKKILEHRDQGRR